MFRNVLVKKQACLDNKNMDFKKGNLDIFSKGLVHDWVKKITSFSLSFLSKKNRIFIIRREVDSGFYLRKKGLLSMISAKMAD